jgi:chemotaxis protein MotB
MQNFTAAIIRASIPAILLLALSGCVTKSTYEALEAEHQQTLEQRDQLIKERNALEQNVVLLRNKISDLEGRARQLEDQLTNTSDTLSKRKKELASTMAELENAHKELNMTSEQLQVTKASLTETSEVLTAKDAALKAKEEELRKAAQYMKRTNKLYDQLVGELKDELAANQVKVQEMKDGINVELAEEILFPSGSATLNDSGQKVIRRVSSKLQDKQYQIIVVGFTDNIPIRGTLAKKYPTNWELAGARAASVVRLLEDTGIDSEKLTASSYGENFPVASNETPEGRAQNRRIEIRLRPLQ